MKIITYLVLLTYEKGLILSKSQNTSAHICLQELRDYIKKWRVILSFYVSKWQLSMSSAKQHQPVFGWQSQTYLTISGLSAQPLQTCEIFSSYRPYITLERGT